MIVIEYLFLLTLQTGKMNIVGTHESTVNLRAVNHCVFWGKDYESIN